jgi:hypothetical protein
VTPTSSGDLFVSVKKSTTCLRRYKTLALSSNYLLTDSEVIPLNQVCNDENKDLLLESSSECGTKKVIIRKEGDKDIWLEVWSNSTNGGLLQSVKISGECSKVYNDAVFGGISWAKDLSKVAFVGEVPAVASFKNPWDTKPSEETKEGEKKADEHWLDEKFEYEEEFGEMLLGKKKPALFVFDFVENNLK